MQCRFTNPFSILLYLFRWLTHDSTFKTSFLTNINMTIS
uniref:Uncharacterized protein n=1 Tax=Siphoviridae sp. ct2wG4 TaxID=2826278 RepID=A0A8S5QXV4_9CAUD|nr:MAG TPA: hypothetical protein [Siphoviridae sp. ct2wG4]DAU49701.1 MAG TPA: hypothetical protein [Caudoviricetes sp.]